MLVILKLIDGSCNTLQAIPWKILVGCCPHSVATRASRVGSGPAGRGRSRRGCRSTGRGRCGGACGGCCRGPPGCSPSLRPH